MSRHTHAVSMPSFCWQNIIKLLTSAFCADARSSHQTAPLPWSPAQFPTAVTAPSRGLPASALGLHGSMLGSEYHTQQQPGSANQMASQIQMAASQLAMPIDPASHNPLAYKQLMLQVYCPIPLKATLALT